MEFKTWAFSRSEEENCNFSSGFFFLGGKTQRVAAMPLYNEVKTVSYFPKTWRLRVKALCSQTSVALSLKIDQVNLAMLTSQANGISGENSGKGLSPQKKLRSHLHWTQILFKQQSCTHCRQQATHDATSNKMAPGSICSRLVARCFLV